MLWVLLALAGMAPSPLAAGIAAEEFTARRAFKGPVRRDMAERAAGLAAEIEALDQAARILAGQSDLRFLGSLGMQNAAPPQEGEWNFFSSSALSLGGLAKMLFQVQVVSTGMEGFPPSVEAMVRVRLAPPPNMRAALRQALLRPDLIEIKGQALERQRKLLARYDQLAAGLLPLRPTADGGMAEQHTLVNTVNEMQALEIFLPLLSMYERHWRTPEKARTELAKAGKLAPKNPLILTAAAEVLLQLDRPVPALERIGEALNEAPSYARAHDIKGAVLLRQRLPSLAAESFSKAIALAPDNAAYRMHRASAYLVLENEAGMCGDFKSACALGDCEGLQWARGVGKCAP